jgi:hypothetical protein
LWKRHSKTTNRIHRDNRIPFQCNLLTIYPFSLTYSKEILVKGLANSKSFQKFAVRTDSHLRNAKEGGAEHFNLKIDELHKAATEAAYSTTSKAANTKTAYHTTKPPVPPKSGFPSFISAFWKEVRKDIGL